MAHHDGAALIGRQDVPALLLAQAAVLVLAGVGVVGMHLDGQVVCGVDDLDEQREYVALAAAEQLAMVGPQPREGLASILAGRDGVIAVGMRGDRPALAHGTVRNLIPEVVRHAATAPDLTLEVGHELDDRIHRLHPLPIPANHMRAPVEAARVRPSLYPRRVQAEQKKHAPAP